MKDILNNLLLRSSGLYCIMSPQHSLFSLLCNVKILLPYEYESDLNCELYIAVYDLDFIRKNALF